MTDVVEISVTAGAEPPEEDSGRAEQQTRVPPGFAIAPDGVPDRPVPAVDVLQPLLRHASGDTQRRDSSRLRHEDVGRAASERRDLIVKDELRELRRLA